MLLGASLLFIIIVLLALRPWMQQRRERAIAEELKKVHDPTEAGIIMDGLINTTRQESDWIEKLSRFWFFFR